MALNSNKRHILISSRLRNLVYGFVSDVTVGLLSLIHAIVSLTVVLDANASNGQPRFSHSSHCGTASVGCCDTLYSWKTRDASCSTNTLSLDMCLQDDCFGYGTMLRARIASAAFAIDSSVYQAGLWKNPSASFLHCRRSGHPQGLFSRRGYTRRADRPMCGPT